MAGKIILTILILGLTVAALFTLSVTLIFSIMTTSTAILIALLVVVVLLGVFVVINRIWRK
jgi:hypothetical protein